MTDRSEEKLEQLDALLGIWGERLHARPLSPEASARAVGEVLVTDEGGRPWYRLSFKGIIAVAILCLAVTGVAWGVTVEVRRLLAEAAQLRQRLDAMHKAVGLDRSFQADFTVQQPNTAMTTVRIDPSLVRLAEVSYDAGGSWKKLYEAGQQGAAEPILRLEDEHAFTPPAAGKAEVTAKVRVQYIPAVLEAFPEYASAEKTERWAEYEVSAGGIQVGALSTTTAAIAASVTPVDSATSPWELTNSANAIVAAESDQKGKGMAVKLALKDIGEWATLSHSIPGATPAGPTVPLKDLTHVEVQLVWDNPAELGMETKLIDDFGKITGIVKFLGTGKALQTVRIPVGSMKPYFGVPQVDLSRIRRIELTFARKTPGQAAEGTVRIESVSLISSKPLPPLWKPPSAYASLEPLSLKPDSWKTAKSAQGEIALAAEGDALTCKVNLPYDPKRDKELPWTSLWMQPQGKSFPGLQAIELEVRWDGEAPITIEPQLSMGSQGDTYGMQVRVQPTKDFQKIMVFPQDMKYFWTFAGETSAKGMDLGNIVSFHLGIARKATDQAEGGTLFIKSIRFLGAGQKPSGT